MSLSQESERIEKAYKDAEGPDFQMYTMGLLFLSVCSSLGKEATVARMASIPSGTRAGWVFSDDETFATGESNPCPCEQKPDTHMHYLFNC
jgi:hypothetical protein